MIRFDTQRFWRDVDAIRRRRGYTGRAMIQKTGIKGHLCQLRRIENPQVNTVAPVARWAGISLDAYLVEDQEEVSADIIQTASSEP